MAYRFQISANLLTWPRNCACCGDSADNHLKASASRTTGKRVRTTKTSWWEVPYCSSCLSHKASFESAGSWLVAGFSFGIVAWYFTASASNSGLIGFIAGLIIFLLSFWLYSQAEKAARLKMKPGCCSLSSAVRYVEWSGTVHTFVFENKAYLDSFLSSNSGKKRSDIKQV